MGFGASLFLIAVGAVLEFAIHVSTNGFNINTIGLILLIIGIVGLILSMVFWGSWGGFGSWRRVERRSGPYGNSTSYVEEQRY